jgi:hypothetical protein
MTAVSLVATLYTLYFEQYPTPKLFPETVAEY